MHDTALALVEKFFELYARPAPVIVEIGAMDVNGSPRNVAPKDALYIGLDCTHGPGVDMIVNPGEPLPLRTDFADIVVSTSQMEHDRFFWRTFLELLRVLKPGGILYLNAPSNGPFHRYPKDNWRFYPDCGGALRDWGRENGFEVTLAESFVADRQSDKWNDFVAIFVKKAELGPQEIGHLAAHFSHVNLQQSGSESIENYQETPEDERIIQQLQSEVAALQAKIKLLTTEVETLHMTHTAWLATEPSQAARQAPRD